MTARVLSHRRVYTGKVLSLDVDEVEEPGGARAMREVVRHAESAAVLAVDDQQRIVLVRQFRYPINDLTWEIPAGLQDPGESAEEGARRELLEEVGADAGHMEPILTLYPTPGYSDEIVHLFRATRLKLGTARPDADETIEAHWFSLEEARGMAERGEVRDARTLLVLLLEQERRPRS